jgi:hypothetical protein
VRISVVRRAVLAATVACGIAGIAMSAGPAVAQVSRPSVAADVVIVTCAGKGVMHPSTYIISCADANNYLKGMTWAFWNSKAGGFGKDAVNNCVPSCAAGKFHSYPVNVSLYRVKDWPHHPGKHYFSRMTLNYTKAVPKGFHRKQVFDLVP